MGGTANENTTLRKASNESGGGQEGWYEHRRTGSRRRRVHELHGPSSQSSLDDNGVSEHGGPSHFMSYTRNPKRRIGRSTKRPLYNMANPYTTYAEPPRPAGTLRNPQDELPEHRTSGEEAEANGHATEADGAGSLQRRSYCTVGQSRRK